ncbi:MAG: hypothetical protein JJV88_04350, partial [Sulfurovum sp.]|nr:hypothetical protein [Sulfurovaceae bacterium]
MSIIIIIFINSFLFSKDKYLDNHSCKECHETIYKEYQSSAHSNSYFTDELHRAIVDKTSPSKYECASCHMPMANNISDLISGKAKPDINNQTHTDGVSCYFCHTIAYVKYSHQFNINIKARQAKNYKPTLYGRLINPDNSDKHSSSSNPVYGKKVCIGCHSHKLNDNNITIFKAMSKKDDSLSCINCHMPEISGGAEKIDKRARGKHASHKFLGIKDKTFRATGMNINISIDHNTTTHTAILNIDIQNKTTHPLIIQPARAKFFKITIERYNKVIWTNYNKSPKEDKQAYFSYNFKNGNTKVIVPVEATSSIINNLDAHENRRLSYQLDFIQKGDKIRVELFVKLAKDECISIVKVNKELNEALLMQSIDKTFFGYLNKYFTSNFTPFLY